MTDEPKLIKYPPRIVSLQSLRGLAFLGVFCQHCGLGLWGTQAVSIFLVLSGFLMVYNHSVFSAKLPNTLAGSLIYGGHKLRKIYPLHLCCTGVCLLVAIYGMWRMGTLAKSDWAFLGQNVLVHLFLIQGWFFSKDVCYGLNGVSWYLSVCLFCYICFPYIIKVFEETSSKQKALVYWRWLALLLFVRVLVILILNKLCILEVISGNVYTRMSYNWPLVRLLDFILGCCLGYCYLDVLHKEYSMPLIVAILFEALSFVLLIVGYFFFLKIYGHSSHPFALNVISGIAICLASLFLVFCFAFARSPVIRILDQKVFRWLGNISAQTYLIHGMLVYGVLRPMKNFPPLGKIAIALPLTIVFSIVYIKCERCFLARIDRDSK